MQRIFRSHNIQRRRSLLAECLRAACPKAGLSATKGAASVVYADGEPAMYPTPTARLDRVEENSPIVSLV